MIKKMLAMLAVVSCAFGAWATHISGTDFSGLSVGTFVTGKTDSGADPEPPTTTYWFNGNTEDFDGNIITNALNEKILDFESNITNPLYRTISGCYNAQSPADFSMRSIGEATFVDTYVQFTPYLVNENHAAPEPTAGQDKLMVWVRETEVDESANITNLIVTAGYLDNGGNPTLTNYVSTLSSAAVSALCNGQQRLTIKAYENITEASLEEGQAVAGFVVYVNQTPIEYLGEAFSPNCAVAGNNLTATAAKWYNNLRHCLFPSLVAYDAPNPGKLSAVGYAGVGQIGNVYFDDYTTSYPGFAADDRDFKVQAGPDIASYMFNGVTYSGTNSHSVAITDPSVIISNVVYASGWKHGNNTWRNGTNVVNNIVGEGGDYGTFLFADGTTFTLAGFMANYIVGETEYQYLADALAAALGGAGALKLNNDIVINEGNGYIEVDENDTLVIDLNGHTLQGTADGNATVANYGGTLTIVDTSLLKTGKVLNSVYGSAVGIYDGLTTLNAEGVYEDFDIDSTEPGLDEALVINAGTYRDIGYDPEAPAFYLNKYLGSGKAVVDWNEVSGDYYAIIGDDVPVTTYAVTFSTNTVVVAEYTTNIAAGATLPVDAIPAFTGGTWDLDPTNAVINAATNFNYTIVASYTLTYASDHGVVPDGVVYTENDSDFALAAAPTADGWQFGGWVIGSVTNEAGATFVVADHLEDTTATAVWTPVAYTLTYVTDKGTAPDAVSYTVESNNFALAEAPVAEGWEFVGWVIGVTTNNAAATYVVADHLANTTATAVWAAIVPPAKFPQSDTAGTEYAGRDGTPALPFVIRNVGDLATLKEAVADGEITTESFEVVSNITGVTDWVGIGSSSKPFSGTLNGNGKTIGITFAAGTKDNGLFRYVSNATISNLTVNVTAGAVSGETGGAAFVGKAAGSSTFVALKATGSLGTSEIPTTHNTAGICERIDTGDSSWIINFNYCTNAMTIYGNYTKVGGILAFRDGGTAVVNFNNCVNSGNVSNAYSTSGQYGTGGLMGWTGGVSAPININGCVNTGTITAADGTAGNFLGYVNFQPTASGTNIGLASLKPSGSSYITGLNWATVSGDIATFVTPVANVGETVTYKLMQSGGAADGFTLTADDASLTIDSSFYAYTGTVSVDESLAADYDLRETAILNGTIYSLVSKAPPVVTYAVTFSTNAVVVAEYNTNIVAGATLPDAAIPAFTGGAWDLDPTNAVINAVTNFNYTISSDPWAPEAQTDAAASNKVVQVFGAGSDVANHVDTLAEYNALVTYIKSVTSQSEVPTDLTADQKTWMWKSFILGADEFFESEPEVEITSLTANSAAGKWDFTVQVTEGADVIGVAADKVAALVKIRTSLSTGPWVAPTAGNIEAARSGDVINVTVNFGDGTSGFMKVAE